jgi:hypothetical protein
MNRRSVLRFTSVAFALLLVTSVFLAGAGFAFAAVTRYEQNHPSVTYTGVWNNWSDPLLSGGSYTWLNSPGTATFTFSGTGVDWIGLKSQYFGYAEVSLDGGPWVQVNAYSASAQYQQILWSASGLTNTPHTLVARWTGVHPLGPQPVYGGGLPPHNPAALVNIDAFDVHVDPPVATVSTAAYSTWSLVLLGLVGVGLASVAMRRRQLN